MKEKIFKIIWVCGVYLLLLVILLMIMVYKIRYQDTINYRYLYFYNCNDDICATKNEKEIVDKSLIYSVYKYQKKDPTFVKLNDEYVKIYDNDKVVLYSIHKRIITNNYKDYILINNDNPEFIAENENGIFGIIDNQGKKQTGFVYSKFTTYNKELIAGIHDNKYGIITLDGKKTFLNFEYDNIIIYDDVIITVKDNTIDIIDNNKQSYITDKITIEDANNVKIEKVENKVIIKENKENEYNEYKFDVDNKVLE